MLLVDAHEDLAFNIHILGRDYTRSAAETRLAEAGGPIPTILDDTLLGWPDYQRGHVALVFSTLFVSPRGSHEGEWVAHTYTNPQEAHTLYQAQLDVYHRLTDDHPDKFRLVQNRRDLEEILSKWSLIVETPRRGVSTERAVSTGRDVSTHPDENKEPETTAPVGLVVLMEGAEGVRAPSELDEWWQRGVRIIGPAWSGNRFCGGTGEPGPLTSEGYALIEAMASLGFGLDLSHMDVKTALQALDAYTGTILASHSNAARLLKGTESNRHLPDEVIRGLFERDGVIGVVPYNRFLLPGWNKGDPRQEVSLHHVVAQIDTLCQMAGDALHVGLGSDFDGGFGLQSVPAEIDTIADLNKLAPLLAEKGYAETDIAAIFGQNWINLLHRILP